MIKYQIPRESVQWESGSKRTEGQADRKRLIVAFGGFFKAPKKGEPSNSLIVSRVVTLAAGGDAKPAAWTLRISNSALQRKAR